jgi:hypothetical protein
MDNSDLWNAYEIFSERLKLLIADIRLNNHKKGGEIGLWIQWQKQKKHI